MWPSILIAFEGDEHGCPLGRLSRLQAPPISPGCSALRQVKPSMQDDHQKKGKVAIATVPAAFSALKTINRGSNGAPPPYVSPPKTNTFTSAHSHTKVNKTFSPAAPVWLVLAEKNTGAAKQAGVCAAAEIAAPHYCLTFCLRPVLQAPNTAPYPLR